VPQWNGRGREPTHHSHAPAKTAAWKGAAGPGDHPPGIDPSVGDWGCTCGNWNWAKRQNCNQCHRSKEDAAGSKRAGDGSKRAGDGSREFDDEEASRRKRRLMEASREKEERKAERKKCEYCKRFACIC
jgi:hypothetical protein